MRFIGNAVGNELQTVLNNRLSDTTKVALWTATSYDAYNKPKGILHGNGLLTRNVYNLAEYFFDPLTRSSLYSTAWFALRLVVCNY
jgi:hypothetical protein